MEASRYCVEKVRTRNTAMVIVPKNGTSLTKSGKQPTRDRICQEFNNNGCRQHSDYIGDGVIMKHSCSQCFKEVGKFYNHKIQDCIRRKTTHTSKEPKNS